MHSTSDQKTRYSPSEVHLCLVIAIIILSCMVPSILALNKVWGNLPQIVDNLQYTLPLSVTVLKLITLWSKREVLAIMNDMMLADWLRAKTEKERGVMQRWARISRMITISGNLLAYATLILFIMLPWFGITIRIATDVENIDHRFLLQSYFLYDMSRTSMFVLTYLFQAFGVILCGISYTAVDNYLIVLIFHICAQFHNLYERILNLGEFKDFRRALASCVQEHVRLLRFIDIIDDSFTLMLLVLLTYFGLLFCFHGFIVINQVNAEVLPFGRMLFTSFAISVTFSHMCLFCAIGEILVIQAQSIYHATYDFEWYTLKPRDAKCLIYMMIRARKPRYISAGKLFPMTMSTFCNLLKTSAGYISVLMANQN